MNKPIWSPSKQQINSAILSEFIATVNSHAGNNIKDYQSLWQWSIDESETFWDLTWDFCGVIGDKGKRILDDNGGSMLGAKFFPDASINYAENLLKNRDDGVAIIFRDETGKEQQITHAKLYNQVSKWQQAMIDCGIKEGDRVAGYMPNMIETIIASLAAISLGALWCCASPDFGTQGVIDRLGQINPKLLIAVDGYYYNGKVIDVLGKVKDVQIELEELEHTIIVPFAGSSLDINALANTKTADDFIEAYTPKDIKFNRVGFNHPLFIMFSSGTTGIPKCIVHGHGGTLLQHLKEHKLHCNIKPNDKVFYFTTCGWMMWNWLVSALASDATLLLFDGSPFYPDGNALWDYTSKHGCSFFGTSAKYIEAMNANNLSPKNTHDLSALKTMASTGSPLVHSSFEYVYENIKSDLHLASISGGTDIVSCFMLGNPISPVYRGEIQVAGLGMAVNIFDDNGMESEGSSGELVCTKAFPSMPVSFWNDEGNKKYRTAYFEKFDNIWCHGDWVERTANNGFIIHGRSDATLNPAGVRIGTAEIYRQLEAIEAVQDCIAVGQDWEGDVRVILFVILKKGWELDSNLIKEIKTSIRKGASPRHVPAKVVAVEDIPRTRNGKITEIAVRDIIMGRVVKNIEALSNPKSLELYKDIEELKS